MHPPVTTRPGPDDRTFFSWLLLVSGPFLQFGGWIAASSIGTVFIPAGILASIVGFALKPRWYTAVLGVLGLLSGSWLWLWFVLAVRLTDP